MNVQDHDQPAAGSRRYEGAGRERLDAWLAGAEPSLSRARWQQLIRDERVLVNGKAVKPNESLHAGDEIRWELPPPAPTNLEGEAMHLDILFEDADLIVINKPPGLVVHPAPGHATGTLVHGLLHHCEDLSGIGGEERPGIVHRLDRDTSGCLIVAKTEAAMAELARQFKDREVKKEYTALVWGRPIPAQGTVRTTIGRDPRHRQKMCADVKHGRDAVTHYETVTLFPDMTLMRLRIETGRTHQIRVHMAHLHHPVVGDRVYGRARKHEHEDLIVRQMLHAGRVSFTHPKSHKLMIFEAPLPADFAALMSAMNGTELHRG